MSRLYNHATHVAVKNKFRDPLHAILVIDDTCRQHVTVQRAWRCCTETGGTRHIGLGDRIATGLDVLCPEKENSKRTFVVNKYTGLN